MRKVKTKFEFYEDLPLGPVAEVETSPLHRTDWHLHGRPVIDHEKCTACRICWIFCPEGAIQLEDGAVTVNYRYCKGCGICAHECPVGAIRMTRS